LRSHLARNLVIQEFQKHISRLLETHCRNHRGVGRYWRRNNQALKLAVVVLAGWVLVASFFGVVLQYLFKLEAHHLAVISLNI
jgi:hypothetical protein